MSLATDATEAKRRVLAVHPGAYAVHWIYMKRWTINLGGPTSPIGRGMTRDKAWIAAAAGLEERNG